MLILKVKLKANINLAFKNIEKHRQSITLHCITPSLELHNDCMACCDYSMHQMRLHNTASSTYDYEMTMTMTMTMK